MTMRPARVLAAIGAATLLAMTAADAASAPPLVRRVIGAGDPVPRLGRVGTYGFTLAGLDDAGRALLVRAAGGRTPSLYWADEQGFTTAFAPESVAPRRPLEWELGWNMRGALALRLAAPEPPWSWSGAALHVVQPDGRGETWVTAGTADAEGHLLCNIDAARINNAGQVAIGAWIATGGRPCGEQDEEGDTRDERVVYVFDDPAVHELAAARAIRAGDQQRVGLVALADDGAAIVAVTTAGRGPSLVRFDRQAPPVVLVDPGTLGADGAPLGPVAVMAANRRGDVLFAGTENGRAGLYRTAGRSIVRVFGNGDAPPPGLRYPLAVIPDGWAALDDAGDVLVQVEYRAVLFPADGTAAQLLDGIALGGALNDRGDVALTELVGDGVIAVTRWRDGEPTRLARTGDVLPGGDALADGGFHAGCAGADGRIAVGLEGTAGVAGLACIDASGPRLAARAGDPAPGGRRFYAFHQCAFSPADSLLFTASILVPNHDFGNDAYTGYRIEPSIYRATPDRLERVIGRGDVASDGSVVFDLQFASIDDGNYPLLLDADARGRVLALATLDGPYGPTALVVRDPDGSLQRLPIALANGGGSQSGVGFPDPSIIDHRFLSGETDTPTLPPFTSAALAGAGASPPSGAPMQASSGGEGRYGLRQARLFGDGVIVLATERIYRNYGYDYYAQPLVLVWSAGTVTRVLEATGVDASDAAYYGGLRVVGPRAAFLIPGERGARLFTYTAGDATAIEQTAPPGRAPIWGLPYLGLWHDGRSLLSWSTTDGTAEVTAWDGATEETLLAHSPGEWLDLVTPDALFVRDDNTLRALAPALDPSAACPVPPTLVMPTRTVTPPWSPTPTRSPLPATPPLGASPTPAGDCIEGAPCLHVGTATGRAGEYASLVVALSGGDVVAGTQNDLLLPGIAGLGECSAGADTGKQAIYRETERGARVLVLSLTDVDPIGDTAALYTCTLRIAPGAGPGRYPIGCSGAHASDPRGSALPLGCTNGALLVSGAPAPTATALPVAASPAARATTTPPAAQLADAAHASGGCAVTSATPAEAWPFCALLLAHLAAALASRAREGGVRPDS